MKSVVVKSIVLFTIIFSTISLSASARGNLFTGASATEKGNYTLEKLENNINFNGKSLETWMITYSFDAAPVLIGIEEKNAKQVFHVKASNMEIDYVADNLGFGVRLPEDNWTTTDPLVVAASINTKAFNQQIKITDNKYNTHYFMQLIACYLPGLTN